MAENLALSVNGLSKVFVKDKSMLTVLDNISFDIYANEFISIIGPSGCGKSTMLRLISDILQPTKGEVKVNGKTPKQARESREIGFVFQDATLLPWRQAWHNVKLPLEIVGHDKEDAKKRSYELLELVGLKGYECSYPRQLSGGMRQRVAIARALTSNPSILLMDEPFGALDEITREKMNGELLRIWAETSSTVIFVTHSIPEAVYLSDRVVVLTANPGRVNRIVEIDLPRPRLAEVKEKQKFTDYVNHLRQLLAERF